MLRCSLSNAVFTLDFFFRDHALLIATFLKVFLPCVHTWIYLGGMRHSLWQNVTYFEPYQVTVAEQKVFRASALDLFLSFSRSAAVV